MKRNARRAVLAVATLTAALAGLAPAAAQIPEEFKNLKVLPEDIDPRELVSMMRGFASALGVRCWGCHVGEEGKPLSTFDFASDEKEEKRIAREMMKMARDVNAALAKIDTEHAEKIEVTCATCHHGIKRPQQLKDILIEAYGKGGLDAALARYRELRGEYYGRYAYDFGVGPLNMFAEFLGEKGEAEPALAVQLLNAELHPDEAFIYISIAQIHHRMGNKAKAVESLQKAIELDPENGFAKRLLQQLQGG